MSDKLPPFDTVRNLLFYDFDRGTLLWKKRASELFKTDRDMAAWNTRYAGQRAFGTIGRSGYFQGAIFGRVYKAHRVIWLLHTGAWPTLEIDHINGDKLDNRIRNLREASRAENCRNKGITRANTSGFKGVYWDRSRLKWAAVIRDREGKQINLGAFSSPETAHAAYCEVSAIYHGEFSNTGC